MRGKGYGEGAPSALVIALPYGNDADNKSLDEDSTRPDNAQLARLDVFSRRNYYAETVARLKMIARAARERFGGQRSDYRILCNSPIPEKPLAAACGLGTIGRNTLVITPEAGSLVVIGILTLPFALSGDGPIEDGDPCAACAACVAACPTGALAETGGDQRTLDRKRCIQWYASRPGAIPGEISAKWEDRLYGCSICRDVCPANKKRIHGTETERGVLPPAFEAKKLIEASDEELSALFKGTALGMSWLGPAAIRRNAALAASRYPKGDFKKLQFFEVNQILRAP